jgi:O-antigen ligase
MYAGMMSAFTLIPAVMLPLKSKLKYGFIVVFVLSAICMFGSDSVGGFLGFGCACVMALIVAAIRFASGRLYRKAVVYVTTGLVVIAVVVVAAAVMVTSDNMIASKIKIISDAVSGQTELANPNFYEDITFDGYKATIVTKAGNIEIDAQNDVPTVSQNGNELSPVNVTSTPYEGVSEEVKVYTYNIDGIKKGELQVHGDKVQFKGYDDEDTTTMFIMQRSNGYLEMLDKFGQPIDKEIEWCGFEGIERLGSNRGYIWSRSIPLLKNNIIIGKGPDTFAMEFPQNDVVAKLRCFGNPYIIVDKPHNIYLQMAINTGVLSLLAVLVLVIFYIVQTISRLAKRNDGEYIDIVRIACVCAVIAYMVAGATTDSVVSVAPVFWLILGTGYGANFITSKEVKDGEA